MLKLGCSEPPNIVAHSDVAPWPTGDHHESSVLNYSGCCPCDGRRRCACRRVSYIRAQRLSDHAAPSPGLGFGRSSRVCTNFDVHAGWYTGLSASAEGGEAGGPRNTITTPRQCCATLAGAGCWTRGDMTSPYRSLKIETYDMGWAEVPHVDFLRNSQLA